VYLDLPDLSKENSRTLFGKIPSCPNQQFSTQTYLAPITHKPTQTFELMEFEAVKKSKSMTKLLYEFHYSKTSTSEVTRLSFSFVHIFSYF